MYTLRPWYSRLSSRPYFQISAHLFGCRPLDDDLAILVSRGHLAGLLGLLAGAPDQSARRFRPRSEQPAVLALGKGPISSLECIRPAVLRPATLLRRDLGIESPRLIPTAAGCSCSHVIGHCSVKPVDRGGRTACPQDRHTTGIARCLALPHGITGTDRADTPGTVILRYRDIGEILEEGLADALSAALGDHIGERFVRIGNSMRKKTRG